MEVNWRPVQGDASTTSGISAGDWRSQSPPESRQQSVNEILETLKRHLPISAPEGLIVELRKIAVQFEKKIYTAAISQEDYLRKISLKMLSMESKTQQPAPIYPAMPISRNQNPAESASMESTTGSGGVPDWQEECYQKVKSMKELYYADINDYHEKIIMKLQQHEVLRPPGKQSDQLEKLKNFRHMLERILSLLQVTKSNIPVGLKDKLPVYETQISIIASHHNKTTPPQGQGQQEQFQHQLRNQQPSQVSQLQLSDNSQINAVNLQSSGASLQNMSMPSPTIHQSASNNTMQSSPNNNDPAQESSFNSMQQSGQQISVNASQQNNMSTLTQNTMNNTAHTPLGNLPLTVTSAPFAPSPIQGESEKPVNSSNHQQSTGHKLSFIQFL